MQQYSPFCKYGVVEHEARRYLFCVEGNYPPDRAEYSLLCLVSDFGSHSWQSLFSLEELYSAFKDVRPKRERLVERLVESLEGNNVKLVKLSAEPDGQPEMVHLTASYSDIVMDRSLSVTLKLPPSGSMMRREGEAQHAVNFALAHNLLLQCQELRMEQRSAKERVHVLESLLEGKDDELSLLHSENQALREMMSKGLGENTDQAWSPGGAKKRPSSIVSGAKDEANRSRQRTTSLSLEKDPGGRGYVGAPGSHSHHSLHHDLSLGLVGDGQPGGSVGVKLEELGARCVTGNTDGSVGKGGGTVEHDGPRAGTDTVTGGEDIKDTGLGPSGEDDLPPISLSVVAGRGRGPVSGVRGRGRMSGQGRATRLAR